MPTEGLRLPQRQGKGGCRHQHSGEDCVEGGLTATELIFGQCIAGHCGDDRPDGGAYPGVQHAVEQPSLEDAAVAVHGV